jgi:hypothetical protein
VDALPQPPVAVQLGADERVEALAALVVAGKQHGLPPRECGLAVTPSRDRGALARCRGLDVAGENVEPPSAVLFGEVVAGIAAMDVREQLAFARVALAHDLAQLIRPQALGQ